MDFPLDSTHSPTRRKAFTPTWDWDVRADYAELTCLDPSAKVDFTKISNSRKFVLLYNVTILSCLFPAPSSFLMIFFVNRMVNYPDYDALLNKKTPDC